MFHDMFVHLSGQMNTRRRTHEVPAMVNGIGHGTGEYFSTSRTSLTGSARPSSFKPIEAHGYYRAWVRPLPPRAASRLSGLVRRLRCFVPKQRHAQCRADLGQGPGHTLQNVHTTNHQSPIKITQRTRGISGISVYGRSKVCFGFGGEVFISILYGQPKMRRSRNSDWGCRVTRTPSHIPVIGCSNKS